MKKFSVILILVVVVIFTLRWIKVDGFGKSCSDHDIDSTIPFKKNYATGNQGGLNHSEAVVGPIEIPRNSRKKLDLTAENKLESSKVIISRRLSTDEIRDIAERRLDSLNIDYSDRFPVVTYNGNMGICSFPVPLPPPGEKASVRGGDFIVIVGLDNGQVMDVKIWR